MATGQPVPASPATARRLYARPPIVEAVIGVGVTLPPKFRVAEIQHALRGDLGYREMQAMNAVEWEGTFEPGASAAASRVREELDGYRWRNSEDAGIVVMQRGRFSYSKLQPYTHWEKVRAEAKRLWQRYAAVARPVSVDGIGLRYVNRIDIPLPAQELREYLLTRLEIAPGLPSDLLNWSFEVGLPQPDLPSTIVVLRQARVEPAKPGVASVLLDIDVNCRTEFRSDYSAMWKKFEELHLRANVYFERTITDKVRELID